MFFSNMSSKLFLILFVTIFLASASEASTCKPINKAALLRGSYQRIFENEISNVVECIREFIKNGIGGFSLDPLKFPILPLNLNTPYFKSSTWFSNIFLGGLAGFNLENGTISIIDIINLKAECDIVLGFNQIEFSTNYDGKIDIFNFLKLYGKGSLGINFDDLKVGVRVVVNVLQFSIETIEVQLTLPNSKVDITGLQNDEYMSGIISRQATDTLNTLAQEHETNLNNLINNYLEQLISTRLASFVLDLNLHELSEKVSEGGFTCNSGIVTAIKFFKEPIKNLLLSAKDEMKNYVYTEN